MSSVQGYLAHKQQPIPLGPPYGTRFILLEGPTGGGVSYDRGTPVGPETLPMIPGDFRGEAPFGGGSGIFLMICVARGVRAECGTNPPRDGLESISSIGMSPTGIPRA